MTRAHTLLTGRHAWLTTGSLSLVLVSGLTQQLVPTAAAANGAAAPRVRAASAAAATVVEPSPEGTSQATDEAAAAPVATPVASPAAPAAAAAAAPAAAPKKKATPKRKTASTGTDVCSGPGWQHKRGSRALASLRHTTPAGVTVSFKSGRSGYLGLTYTARRHVDVFVRSCSAESWTLLRHVMAHEMGHAYDAAHLTAASRAAYMARRGIPAGTPWFGCNYCTDFATPAGDFAETYSQWQRGSADSRTKMASMPGPAALARLGAAFFSR